MRRRGQVINPGRVVVCVAAAIGVVLITPDAWAPPLRTGVGAAAAALLLLLVDRVLRIDDRLRGAVVAGQLEGHISVKEFLTAAEQDAAKSRAVSIGPALGFTEALGLAYDCASDNVAKDVTDRMKSDGLGPRHSKRRPTLRRSASKP